VNTGTQAVLTDNSNVWIEGMHVCRFNQSQNFVSFCLHAGLIYAN
jgi:hypothetical protein